ncbi:MAG: lipoyl protein ligase domain-containing protein [Solirubrobacteraceae bacterium]
MELYDHAASDAALDVAVSHALLNRAARKGFGSLRLWRPLSPALSVGRLDVRHPRLDEVLALARAAAVTPVRRLAGGHAATLDSGCLCLGWAQAHPRLEESSARYELIAGALVEALGALDVQSSLGESPGEWCPGAWSVQGPSGKLAGLAQRVVSGGAWCEALIVIRAAPELRALARQAHRVLDLEWGESAQGELAELVPAAPDLHMALSGALTQALARRLGPIKRHRLPADVHADARALVGGHRF